MSACEPKRETSEGEEGKDRKPRTWRDAVAGRELNIELFACGWPMPARPLHFVPYSLTILFSFTLLPDSHYSLSRSPSPFFVLANLKATIQIHCCHISSSVIRDWTYAHCDLSGLSQKIMSLILFQNLPRNLRKILIIKIPSDWKIKWKDSLHFHNGKFIPFFFIFLNQQ